jgi:two-component system LytT family sensor kinase
MKQNYSTMNKKTIIIIHLAVWLIMFGFFPLLIYIDSMRDTIFLKRSIVQTLIFISIFYLNYFVFIPKFFFLKKKIYFALSAVFTIILALFIFNYYETKFESQMNAFKNKMHIEKKQYPDFENIDKTQLKPIIKHRPSKKWPYYNFLLITLLISGISLGLRLSEKLIQNERSRKEAEKEKLNSELAFLKNQVSPHFFFNTLNNIYSLVEINTSEGQKAIIQLSKLMRYLLYESEHGNTLLSREIEFMTNFVDLMKLRLSSKIQLKVVFPKKFNDIEIPPLLFISFIENAFKHGISYAEPSFINIHMSVNKKEIYFWCSNSLITKDKEDVKTASGIGLENVRKRLELLYPNKHHLIINTTEVFYSVALTIEI